MLNKLKHDKKIEWKKWNEKYEINLIRKGEDGVIQNEVKCQK